LDLFTLGMTPTMWIVLVTGLMGLAGILWSKRRDMEELRSSEERYRVLFDQSPKPMYAFDLETLAFLNVNEAALRHYGYSRQEFLSMTADKIRPPEEMALMLQRTSSGTQTACMTRHRKKDGSLIDVEVSVQHLLNGNRTVVLVAVNDVTDKKRAEQNLKLAHESLSQSVNELQKREVDLRHLAMAAEMLQACHTSGEAFSMVSELLPKVFPGYSGCLYVLKASRDMVEGVAVWGNRAANESSFPPDDCWALRRGRTHLIEDGRGPRCKHSATLPTTLCIPMMAQSDAMGVLHLVPDGQYGEESPAHIPLALQSIAKAAADQIALALSNIRFREALQHQSIRDPLTTLFNRRYMEESLERELYRARRNSSFVAVVMLDVDHFKRFNDTHGHRTADRMLCLLSRYMQSSVRFDDIVCRYGGEEFVLILPSSTLEDTMIRTRQIQEGARQLRLEADGPVATLTISAGVAVFPTHGADSETLLAAADHALYEAKRSGRDRLAVSELFPLVTPKS
jgi:diguanylate cyclase (GGDEF)-like protein/PAS domain S-box-containing protein